MTMPNERIRAVLQTRQFLQELKDPRNLLEVPPEVQHMANVLLRHFPDANVIVMMRRAMPEWFE